MSFKKTNSTLLSDELSLLRRDKACPPSGARTIIKKAFMNIKKTLAWRIGFQQTKGFSFFIHDFIIRISSFLDILASIFSVLYPKAVYQSASRFSMLSMLVQYLSAFSRVMTPSRKSFSIEASIVIIPSFPDDWITLSI